jgi:hypothetical protein
LSAEDDRLGVMEALDIHAGPLPSPSEYSVVTGHATGTGTSISMPSMSRTQPAAGKTPNRKKRRLAFTF